MVNNPSKAPPFSDISIAIAWCLVWGNNREPQFDLSILQQMRQALSQQTELPKEVRALIEQVQQLDQIPFPNKLEDLQTQYSSLWKQTTQIGLVYGGATKIKQYVFEAAKLPDVRGASALLDRINLVDLPAFFNSETTPERFPQCHRAEAYCQQEVRAKWLNQPENFPELSRALIPELIIYSTGGNILAFCPAAYVQDLANAIEKRYTEETLTANSCAVGATFRLLELRFGVLQNPIEKTFWQEQYFKNLDHPIVQAYFTQPESSSEQAFIDCKSFNELAGKLAGLFNQRRNGNHLPDPDRPSRCYPPMFETHPYLVRDGSDRRSAVIQAVTDPNDPSEGLPGNPWFSEALARKRLVGQIAKREYPKGQLPNWYRRSCLQWHPGEVESWVDKFEQFLINEQLVRQYDPEQRIFRSTQRVENPYGREARSLKEISNASTPKGFVAYIYADGNNMGGYIQKIKTPLEYRQFSEDIFEATERAVYKALGEHLKPHRLDGLNDSDTENRNGCWIHPFEILTIGGDDVMLIVPADKALAIAQTIGEEFERQLLQQEKGDRYRVDETYNPKSAHRYKGQPQLLGLTQCKLSMSAGVLITALDTPIYYAERLTNELLKSAKKLAKELKKEHKYYGGTVDFFAMKSVTMLSSSIKTFREQGLIKSKGQHKLKLYAAPYTLYEIGGLLATLRALKDAQFPRSQLYQIRSLLEQGKNTAILNYRYFRVRLSHGQSELEQHYEEAWCQAQTNGGNLAPWRFAGPLEASEKKQQDSVYETIWRELVDLYPFVEEQAPESSDQSVTGQEVNS